MGITILPKNFYNHWETTNSLLALIARNTIDLPITSWQQVQHIVRAGLHHQVFQVGDQFVTEFNGTAFCLGCNRHRP